MSRADRRRAERTTVRRETTAGSATTPSRFAASFQNATALEYAAFFVLTAVFFVALWRMLGARITWYLAVDQFGYLQFAHDLLHGKVFHDWEPARIMGVLPKRTDVLAQTYVYDHGRMYCRYSPGFPLLVAGWIGLFGDARVSFLNPTIYLTLLGMVIACAWRLTGSVWRGFVVAALIALCPTQMYWWALTLTRDLSAHLFALIGLYQLIPREQPLDRRRMVVAGLALGYAGSIRNDAVLYLAPATLLAVASWRRARPVGSVVGLAGIAVAGLAIGLLPTLSYNAIATGNPFRPTQGMEIQSFLPSEPPPAPTLGAKVGYPSVWKGGSFQQVQGGGLRLQNLPRTAPAEWGYVQRGYGSVLLGLALLGALVALARRPVVFLFAVPYTVLAFLFYSCWARPDQRYIIGIFTMVPFLVAEGVFGTLDLLRDVATHRGDDVARPAAVVVGLLAVAVALAAWTGAIAPPAATPDAPYMSKGVLLVLPVVLSLALGIGAMVAALAPSRPVTRVLAPILMLVLCAYATMRANETSTHRAPFQGPEAALARETLRRTLEPRSVVITAEDMGRPAENIEHYGGFPAFYVTDLLRWRLKLSSVVTSFLAAGVRPYLLIDKGVPERDRILADLAQHDMLAERVVEVPPARNREYFVAAPVARPLSVEIFRISYPKLEELLRGIQKP